MSGIKALKIGDLVLQRQVIQGGMGVGISLHKLAGAVAASGGMGLISTAQIGFEEPDFVGNEEECNLRGPRPPPGPPLPPGPPPRRPTKRPGISESSMRKC